MHDYVIIIVYHANDPLTQFHYQRFVRFHPNVPVVMIKSENFDQPDCWKYDWMWAYCDNIFYRWFLSDQKILANKYCIFDYDTLCNQPVTDFYSDVWNDRFVCSAHFSYEQNPGWHWFKFYDSKFHNPHYRQHRHGALPFSGMIIQHDDANLLIQTQINDIFWKDCISELRIGTILRMNSIPMSSLPKPKDRYISPFTNYLPENFGNLPGIFHPVKTIQVPA